jgi:hypothetical protein
MRQIKIVVTCYSRDCISVSIDMPELRVDIKKLGEELDKLGWFSFGGFDACPDCMPQFWNRGYK